MGLRQSLVAATLAGCLGAACLDIGDAEDASNAGGAIGSGGGGGTAGTGSTAGSGAAEAGPPTVVVQSGELVLAGGEAQESVALTTPVESARTVLFFTHRGDNEPARSLVRGALSDDGKSVSFLRHSTSGGVEISWYLLEHSELRVQRGLSKVAGTQLDIPISDVDLGRAFALASYAVDGSVFDSDDFARIGIPSSNLARVALTKGNPNLELAWQVVEVDEGSAVVGGQISLGLGALSKEFPLSSPFDSARSFLVYRWSASSMSNMGSSEGSLSLKGRFKSPTTIELSRTQSDSSLDVDFFAVRLASAQVLVKSVAFTGGSGSVTIPAFDPKKTLPVASYLGAQGPPFFWGGVENFMFRAALGETDAGGLLQVFRGGSNGEFDSEIYVLSF